MIKEYLPAIIPVVLAIFTFMAKPRTPEEYAAMPAWLAKTCLVIAAVGPDVLKAYKIITEKKDSK